MSMRTERDQIDREYQARERYLSDLTPAERKLFNSMTQDAVTRFADCEEHVGAKGLTCFKGANCINRRKAAARAGAAQ